MKLLKKFPPMLFLRKIIKGIYHIKHTHDMGNRISNTEKKNKSKDRGEVKSQNGRNTTDLENKFLLN